MVDLFEKYNIDPKSINKKRKTVDLFDKYQINPDAYRTNPHMQQEPQESTGLMGVAGDAVSGLGNMAAAIPGLLASAPSEIAGAGRQLFNNPKRAMQNLGGGFLDFSHGVASTPGNIRDYLVKKQLASKESPSFRLPESILPREYNYQEALGREGEQEGDTLLSGLPGFAVSAPLEGLALSKALSTASKLKPKSGYKMIQEAHDTEKARLGNEFDKVKEIANKKNIEVPLSKDMFNKTKELGSPTKAFELLLQKASKGEYNAVHDLQSDLYHRGAGYKASPLKAEQDYGDLILEHRGDIIDAISDALKKRGQTKTAEDLRKARAGWSKLQNTFHGDNLISKLVGTEREVPDSIKPLYKDSAFMNALRQEIPGLQKKLSRQRIAKNAKRTAYGLGAANIIKNTYNEFTR